VTWKALRHPNVLPLLGVVMSEAHFAMISDWMVNGNINDFVKAHPNVNRLELVGCSFNISPIHHKCSLTTDLVGRRRKRVDLHP